MDALRETVGLDSCSLDEAIGLLLSGVSIGRPGVGSGFRLSSADSLKAFGYYSKNRTLWLPSKQIQAKEISDLLQALAGEVPRSPVMQQRVDGSKPFWLLKRVEIHRFGGLHRHCAPDGSDPTDFVLDFESDITLISGFNGAGKTALLSAIIWCLTGKALRSQHMPDAVHEPILVDWPQSEVGTEGADETERHILVPPIVPIPTGSDLAALSDKPVLDTWVRLTFRNKDYSDSREVTRRLVSQPGGRTIMVPQGLEELGLPTLAIEVGTLMPGIAAHMRFDEKSDFAQAVAQLTGLKPLEELGRRTQRMVNRLRKDERGKTENARLEKLAEFERAKRALVDAWRAQSDLGEPADFPPPSTAAIGYGCAASIMNARQRLKELQRELTHAVNIIFGRPIELTTKQDVEAFLKGLRDAFDQLKGTALGALPSFMIIRDLGSISEEDAEDGAALISGTVRRAQELATRLEDKRQAARWQLYVRVATWYRNNHPNEDLENCPVCGTGLSDVPDDALVDLSVKDALARCKDADADVAKNRAEWLDDEAAIFLAEIPPVCRQFADAELPATLDDLYRQAFVDELLSQPSFSGRLQPMAESGRLLWIAAMAEHPLPAAEMEATPALPSLFQDSTLAKRISNVARAIKLARHRARSRGALDGLTRRYVGLSHSTETAASLELADIAPRDLPLRNQIDVIRRSVQNAAPIVSLLRQLDEIDCVRQQWEVETDRLQLLVRAAAALEPFLQFPDLVYEQVSGLISTLDSDTRDWLKRLYRPHYNDGPDYSGLDPRHETGFGMRAGISDMRLPAHHVMNASLLRACVWAFLFSFWGHVHRRAGGLNCVLLDDPQTHFDPINSENLANAIISMPNASMNPIVTSNDSRFIASMQDKLPARATDYPSWAALRIDPISASRLTASVSSAVEEIRERRDRLREDDNNTPKAHEFVERVRVDVENRLWNLLATDPIFKHSPTLSDLLNQLRGSRNRGERPFDEKPFEKLLGCPALKADAPFYTIINQAHHRLSQITPFHAKQVDKVFEDVEFLLRSCAASYARFMGRLIREDDDLLIDCSPPPSPTILPRITIAVLGTLSARSKASSLAAGVQGETFSLADLGSVALYMIRAPTLGTLALTGQVVIVSLEREARDGDPVVAVCAGGTYARRLHKTARDMSRITLTSDRSGTDRVPPTIVLPTAATQVMPIVGVLYESALKPPGRDEAVPVNHSTILSRRLQAAHVVDDSAHPVIRDGDLVLLEVVADLSRERVASLEGSIVAVSATGDAGSFGFLKRMGAEVSPGLRIFESIGLNGTFVCIGMSNNAKNANLKADGLWRVHGVLRLAARPAA